MKLGSNLQAATKWLGIIVGFLTITLGIIHMIDRNPRLEWPAGANFLDDTNYKTWRVALFSLAPKVFSKISCCISKYSSVDTWTPMVFGIWALLAHFPKSGRIFTIVTKDFLNYGVRMRPTRLTSIPDIYAYTGSFR